MMKPAAFGSKITDSENATDSDTVTVRYSTAIFGSVFGVFFALLTLIAVEIVVNGNAGVTGVVIALVVFAVGAFLLVYVLWKVRSDGGRAMVIGNDGVEYLPLDRKSRFYVPWSEVTGVRYKSDNDGIRWFVLDLRAPRSKFRVEGQKQWHDRYQTTSLTLASAMELKISHGELARLIHAHVPDADDAGERGREA
jgi:hypothetical protein